MKTLNEEIAAIKAAKTSRADKNAALVKLGITNYEISMILKSESQSKPGDRFTFGVEIECFVNRGAIRTAAQTTGMAYEYEGYNHRDGQAHFKFVPDCSVRGLDGAIECVSPVLTGKKGKSTLENACATLNQANARVNRTCGLHVHIGAAKLTGSQFANVFNNYYYLESLIDGFMAPSRRGNNNNYCRSVIEHHRLTSCDSVSDVQYALGGRYFKINPMAYNSHKTIEFRQHQGTTDYEKIINWVSFCGKLVMWSKNHRLTEPVQSIDDIEFLTKAEKDFFKARTSHFASL